MAMRRRCAMWTGRRLPDGRPGWLLVPVILASFASGAAAQAQKTRVPPTPSACHVEPFGSGVVARVVDGRTFVLADGREVRLAGIEVPPEADGEAAVGTPRFSPPPARSGAENPGEIAAERGRFTLVEGKVVSVRESGGTIYVNFGRRWSEDFTVTISKRHERIFAAAGLEPQKLSGRRVVVRGWVEERGGPWIEASTPEQIEIVADK